MSEPMRDHWWWRPGWQIGRSFYTWHFTFENQPAMRRLWEHYQPVLSTINTLDPVDFEVLHLTTQGVGFTDEVTTADIDAIIDRTRHHSADIEPFTVTVGPARIEPETVKMLAQPAEPIIEVRQALRDAIADIWGTENVPETMDGFRPHISLAYSNTAGPAEPIARALAASEPATEDILISTVSLINLNRDYKSYQWRTIAAVNLGQR
ncbi:2'-5' RNA ligase family protein [Kibdelosporangium persicum]|uniref:2'-5' RNA ligase n=1 Tax=Kibdelosporangium persicum TaxID=2698649 RepID=A0ABX2FGK5_9PSEU|nr:2'-5' RNA ligase family protein [Kibdelosporangium persicum]NRN70037.1 2'-5' RNA ligase [Kibdelosporangium persicum]